MRDIITNDLSGFGYRELDLAADLLKKYAEHGSDFLDGGMTLNFNSSSGYVFLSDEDYNVGIIEDGNLVQFFTCSECDYENTQLAALEDKKNFIQYEGFCSKECFNKNN